MSWLIVGLGNPGSRYAGTPHNLGFDVVDVLVGRHGLQWTDQKRFKCVAAAGSLEEDKIFLLKPMTYMNVSGEAVQPFAAYFKVPTERIVVVCDDVALPWGKIRLRERGSAGGHNGLKDLIGRLGSEAFPRLRIGCAPIRKPRDMSSYVLSPMWGEARELADHAVEAAADCIEEVLEKGCAKAMSRWNAWSADPKPEKG